MSTNLITLLITAGLAAGCATSGYGTYYASATYTTPDLVYVAPGVRVIANYDVPIFYSGGAYWLYDRGYWYRSPRYTGGWVYVPRPPHAIASIRSPYVFRYYRPRDYRPRYRPVPSYRVERPVYRDYSARPYYDQRTRRYYYPRRY